MIRNLLLAAWLLACGDDDRTQSAELPTAEPAIAEPAVADATPPAIDEARVIELVDAWMDAQNAGDFEAYEALYAERFEGVKRSGERVYRFDRAGWLDDRRRMFARPMSVAIADRKVATSVATAVVTFEQTWEASTYRDIGPKQLVVIAEGGVLRIAREEMLRSTIDSAAAPVPPLENLMLVVRVGRDHHVVLSAAPQEDWGAGPITLAQREDPATSKRRANSSALPDTLRAWSRRAVQLHGATGPTCAGTVGELRVLRRVVPHFGTRQHWTGELGDVPSNDTQIAADIWELAGEAGAILAGLVIPEAECVEPLWARAASAPAPVVRAPAPAPAPLATRALAAFRAVPSHASLQRDYLADGGARGAPWDEMDSQPAVLRWSDATSGRALVTVRAVAGNDCGSFGGRLWSLFDQSGASLTRVTPDDPGEQEPLAIVDADGDGAFEIVVPNGLLRRTPAGITPALDIAPPFLDCGC